MATSDATLSSPHVAEDESTTPKGDTPENGGNNNIVENADITDVTLNYKAAEDVTDTIALADEARRHQGNYEVEVSFGGEADLHAHNRRCKKNPGHKNFIPACKFGIEHLPQDFRDPDILEMVRAISDLTVRVSVKYISKGRPDFFPDSTIPYPFAAYRGRRMTRVGTGRVWDVARYSEKDPLHCYCRSCKATGHIQRQWGKIEIQTATHVVFDEAECINSACHFFYDKPDSVLSDIPVFEPMEYVYADICGDRTRMKYLTHDMEFLDRLEKTYRRYEELYKTLYNKYDKDSHPPLWAQRRYTPDAEPKHKLTIIVSHPHGCNKQVTVGEWTERETVAEDWTTYTYTTPTCPGSSGAPVYILGRWLSIWCDHPHSKGLVGANLNSSGIGKDNPPQIRQNHQRPLLI